MIHQLRKVSRAHTGRFTVGRFAVGRFAVSRFTVSRLIAGLSMATLAAVATGCTINIPEAGGESATETVEAPATDETEAENTGPDEAAPEETPTSQATIDDSDSDSDSDPDSDPDDRDPEQMQADFDEASEKLDDLMAELDEDMAELGIDDESATAPATSDYTVPGGYTMHTGRNGRFQVALPDTYQVIDLDADDMESMTRDLSDDPQRAAQAAEALENADQFVLWAFDISRADEEFTPNVNVQIYEAGPLERDLDLIEEQIPAHFESQGLELVRMRRAMARAGEMLRLESVIPSTAFDGYSVQLLMIDSGYVYSFNFTFKGEPTAEQKGELEKALQSFTLLT